jgi:predicted nucleotidyltransferase
MVRSLHHVIEILRSHETELRAMGVTSAAVFGSVARGEARTDSDIDVLIDLDQARGMGLFEYARLKLYFNEIFEGGADVVNRKSLKPLLSQPILQDAVHAF